MYTHVCIYIYMYIYTLHTYKHVKHTCIHKYIYKKIVYIYTYTYKYIYLCIYVYIYIYAYIYKYICTYLLICIYVYSVYIYIYIYIHTHVYTFNPLDMSSGSHYNQISSDTKMICYIHSRQVREQVKENDRKTVKINKIEPNCKERTFVYACVTIQQTATHRNA